MTSTQRHNRNMRAIGKALQAAGGHTTAGSMVAGVAAGAVHVGGGLVGAQNVTQRGVNAVRRRRQRRRDIQAGLGPNYTQNQQRQQQANQAGRNAGGPGARPGTGAQGNNPQGQTRNDCPAPAADDDGRTAAPCGRRRGTQAQGIAGEGIPPSCQPSCKAEMNLL